jgi:hypothetical protein
MPRPSHKPSSMSSLCSMASRTACSSENPGGMYSSTRISTSLASSGCNDGGGHGTCFDTS